MSGEEKKEKEKEQVVLLLFREGIRVFGFQKNLCEKKLLNWKECIFAPFFHRSLFLPTECAYIRKGGAFFRLLASFV